MLGLAWSCAWTCQDSKAFAVARLTQCPTTAFLAHKDKCIYSRTTRYVCEARLDFVTSCRDFMCTRSWDRLVLRVGMPGLEGICRGALDPVPHHPLRNSHQPRLFLG